METENYQVSKSKGLLALSELNLSLNELKIGLTDTLVTC